MLASLDNNFGNNGVQSRHGHACLVGSWLAAGRQMPVHCLKYTVAGPTTTAYQRPCRLRCPVPSQNPTVTIMMQAQKGLGCSYRSQLADIVPAGTIYGAGSLQSPSTQTQLTRWSMYTSDCTTAIGRLKASPDFPIENCNHSAIGSRDTSHLGSTAAPATAGRTCRLARPELHFACARPRCAKPEPRPARSLGPAHTALVRPAAFRCGTVVEGHAHSVRPQPHLPGSKGAACAAVSDFEVVA
eukprot:354023-Chlamydomonas_euryale.AAC.3